MPRSTEGCSSPSPPRHTIKPSNAGGHAVQYGCSSLSPPRHTIKSTSAGVSPPTVKSLTLCFESAEWVGATDGAALSAADLGAGWRRLCGTDPQAALVGGGTDPGEEPLGWDATQRDASPAAVPAPVSRPALAAAAAALDQPHSLIDTRCDG